MLKRKEDKDKEIIEKKREEYEREEEREDK